MSQIEEDTEHSREVQVRAMVRLAHNNGWALDLNDVFDENELAGGNASGGAHLSDRPGLANAVAMIERGEAQVILAERFDRFFRDLDVQRQVINRVEAAGGSIATTAREISHATAEAELNANLNGSIAQYVRRTAKERSFAAVEVAIEQGKVPWCQTPPGYVRGQDSTLRPSPDEAVTRAVVRAFEMRLAGATVEEVRAHLREHGIERSYHGTQHLLRDRVYIGEIHFGSHTPNLRAHEPIVARELFEAVQAMKVHRGRRPKANDLLARLGVLRCASCGARMVVASSNNSQYRVYRCPPIVDCERHANVSARIADAYVVAAVKAALADVDGRASAATMAREAAEAAAAAQERLDGAIRTFKEAGMLGEPAALEALMDLRLARDEAVAHAEQVGPGPALVITAATDWDRLLLDERRDLIRAVVERVDVTPGRGRGRLAVKLLGEQASGGAVQDALRVGQR